ncbi:MULTISPECIES: PD-(D/E)XK motif protein [Aeromonas]|uniref:PD-(D/E)XK motif protein n=2 Tax=Aeromonadaceae TaxID=84642 RepID=UPI000A749739|nr:MULTISPECIES: PD-(D/E)XK motif protein [Aeromonas]
MKSTYFIGCKNMARPSEEFNLAWLSLSCDSESLGWQAISLPSAGPVGVQAGRCSPNNTEAVLFTFPTAKLARTERLPEGKGFLVEKAGATEQGGIILALTRQGEGDLGLFVSMVCDVVGAVDEAAADRVSESSLLRLLIRRVLAWQQFMSRHSGHLSPEAELGLVGELCIITALLDACVPPMEVLKGWVGPNDAPQDFLLGDGAIEVKATMSASGFPVKIGSLEQLDDAVASPLFLAAVRFANLESGLTLPEMIAQIEQRLKEEPIAISILYEQLMCAGFTEAHRNEYTRRFKLKDRLFFSVSEGFPRMTSGSVPFGVTHALYEINLEHVGDFLIDLDVAIKKLGVAG